jgi:Putative abortive phage resistance protein AbiGi, antitoxin
VQPPPREIREILHRRTDLSTFVVHLTRTRGGVTGLHALASIARLGVIEAPTAMGWAKDQDDAQDPRRQTQRVVCFSETPLEHIHLMLGPMEPSRDVIMEPYGLALTKLAARKLGINPIWYVDTTPGREWVLANTLDSIRDWHVANAAATGTSFHDWDMARVFPFIEQMGRWPTTGRQKEFWWEREWRHAGHFTLPTSGLIWLCPEHEVPHLTQLAGRELRPWIDPQWGLERIIARLAGFAATDVSPFEGE